MRPGSGAGRLAFDLLVVLVLSALSVVSVTTFVLGLVAFLVLLTAWAVAAGVVRAAIWGWGAGCSTWKRLGSHFWRPGTGATVLLPLVMISGSWALCAYSAEVSAWIA